jgi:hypothetical protein
MRFFYPTEFEIPADWLAEADVTGFTPQHVAYARSPADFPVAIVSMVRIRPPKGVQGKQFERDRMISVLRAIKAGVELPPVPVHKSPDDAEYEYAVRDGMHRFYAAAAAGYKYLPVTIIPTSGIAEPTSLS